MHEIKVDNLMSWLRNARNRKSQMTSASPTEARGQTSNNQGPMTTEEDSLNSNTDIRKTAGDENSHGNLTEVPNSFDTDGAIPILDLPQTSILEHIPDVPNTISDSQRGTGEHEDSITKSRQHRSILAPGPSQPGRNSPSSTCSSPSGSQPWQALEFCQNISMHNRAKIALTRKYLSKFQHLNQGVGAKLGHTGRNFGRHWINRPTLELRVLSDILWARERYEEYYGMGEPSDEDIIAFFDAQEFDDGTVGVEGLTEFREVTMAAPAPFMEQPAGWKA
ncbi:hypothetical protein B0O99DRAFT_18318 [Bisporella sp. PMI_857]|nr:hypothetical protein B0O99DRAFT_18318 [Bisporella sp. PMI_857]